MKLKKSKQIDAYIPTASMADIAFLLIIFFITSTVFPLDKTQMKLPATIEEYNRNYPEDSAVIALTTKELENLRDNIDASISGLTNYANDEVQVKTSDGLGESSVIYEAPLYDWDMRDPLQFDRLKQQIITEFIDNIERRRKDSSKQIIVVVKADAKLPFEVVDGVIKVLQEIGGNTTRGGIAILSQLEEG